MRLANVANGLSLPLSLIHEVRRRNGVERKCCSFKMEPSQELLAVAVLKLRFGPKQKKPCGQEILSCIISPSLPMKHPKKGWCAAEQWISLLKHSDRCFAL